MPLNKAAIYSSLCYSDIFEYPLTKEEIFKMSNVKCQSRLNRDQMSNLEKELKGLERKKIIGCKEEYYFLNGREKNVEIRKLRAEISESKILIAKNVCKILSKVPTIEFVGISGSLALMNAKNEADIDIFVICKKNSLWLTRLIIMIIFQLKNVRRKRNLREEKDKICLNMIIDNVHLEFPKNRWDIYTAHEIIQMKPIFSRESAYENFLKTNNWIKRYLPNAYYDIRASILDIRDEKYIHNNSNIQYLISNIFISVFESLARTFQLWYMRGHITNETISDGFVAFHPLDYRKKILKEWKDRLKTYGV